jgi:5-hydroxyisourate hydrolase
VNLSVHVTDTASGVPAANVRVALRRSTMSGWMDLAEGHTGLDGQLTVWSGASCGSTFRLECDLDRYYSILGSIPLFPRGIVVFRVGDSDEDLHLILLISPSLLLTYRGSADERNFP